MTDKQKSKILWFTYIGSLIVSVFTHGLLLPSLESPTLIDLIIIALPLLLVLLHSTWTLGYPRGLLFLFLSAITGFIFEFIGLRYGTLFGGHYFYHGFTIQILTVPLAVCVYWAVFIYIGYSLVSSFLTWTNREKPQKKNRDSLLLFLLILLDGVVVTAIDLFMDPLQVEMGNWSWTNGSPYFNIPLGNFGGWFLVTIISTGIFRLFEYFFPPKINLDKSVYLIPVLGYGTFGLLFLTSALNNQMPDLALIGAFAMFPIFSVNLMLYLAQGQSPFLKQE